MSKSFHSLWTPEPAPKLTPAERTLQRGIRRQVRRAFDPDALKRVCTDASWRFEDRYGKVERFGDGPDDFYIYQDNGSPVLAVAHLDSVQDKRRFFLNNNRDNPIAWAPTLDDRLGAYVIAELLPALGIKPDLLLTSGEESMNSSAEMFTTDKSYNWMVSFDRGGTDVVMYDYDTDAHRALVRAAGAPVGHGSYSDIASLTHLGCAGFNWGVAYRDYHTKQAFVPLNELFLSVARFVRFWQANADTPLPFAALPQWWQRGYGAPVERDNGSFADECPTCGEEAYSGAGKYCLNCGYDEWERSDHRSLHGLTEEEWTRIEKQVEATKAQESFDLT